MRPLKALLQVFSVTVALALSGLAHAEVRTVWDTYDNNGSSFNALGVGFVDDSQYSLNVRIVPTASGYLKDITVPFSGPSDAATTLNFSVREDVEGLPGNPIGGFDATALPQSTYGLYTVAATDNVYLVAGTAYWISATTTNNTAYWDSIKTGTGTWVWCFGGCSFSSYYNTNNQAPALEVRVDTELYFDFNDTADGYSECREEGSLQICDNPYFDKYYDNPNNFLRVSTLSYLNGAVPQQNVSSGVLQLVRNPVASGASSVLMRITVNGGFEPGVQRFRFTVTNRSTQPVELAAQLAGQTEYNPATFARTVPAGSTQTVCYRQSDLQVNASYTGVVIQSANQGPTPLVTWDNLYVDVIGIGPEPSCDPPVALDNDPTPAGTNVPVVRLDQFQMTAAEVTDPGYTSADFCIAPDPREVKVGATWRYTARTLRLSELANRGTCKGLVSDGGNWPALLTATGLEVAPWFRTFIGKAKIGGTGVKGVEAPWVVVAIIRTSAEYKGAVGVSPLAEKLVDYGYNAQLSTAKGELQCDAPLAKRPLSLGGTVQSFGDYMNVEDERMILETGQCDGGVGLTRRTTHVFPMRLDPALYSERSNVMTMLDGISRTLTRAGQCVANPTAQTALNTMSSHLAAARVGISAGTNPGYNTALARLHDFALVANNDAQTANFGACPAAANYKGTFIVRAINSAFTVFDRLLHPLNNPDPDTPIGNWEIYFPPNSINLPLIVQPF